MNSACKSYSMSVRNTLSPSVLHHMSIIFKTHATHLKDSGEEIESILAKIDDHKNSINDAPNNTLWKDFLVEILHDAESEYQTLVNDIEVYQQKNDHALYAVQMFQSGDDVVGRFVSDKLFDINLVNQILEFAINASLSSDEVLVEEDEEVKEELQEKLINALEVEFEAENNPQVNEDGWIIPKKKSKKKSKKLKKKNRK